MKDTDFIRGNIPMTKEEIRTIVLEKLELKSTDILMDIGAGTGSVAIDAASRLTSGKVIAIEQNKEAVELIHKNIEKHKLSNLEVIYSKAPFGMHDLKTTNKFFIGGSGGNLTDILTLISQKSVHTSIIVVTAIVLDTMIKAYEFFKRNNYHFELIQVQVNKVDTEKKAAMLLAQNPIFVLTARKNF